mmetsp:Transcript_23078/g.63982  ORF Transcript_23078/g.63982 Transcript_23078/m.63982 type:complete len:200 (+) Transcript_23078:705-1304(+)
MLAITTRSRLWNRSSRNPCPVPKPLGHHPRDKRLHFCSPFLRSHWKNQGSRGDWPATATSPAPRRSIPCVASVSQRHWLPLVRRYRRSTMEYCERMFGGPVTVPVPTEHHHHCGVHVNVHVPAFRRPPCELCNSSSRNRTRPVARSAADLARGFGRLGSTPSRYLPPCKTRGSPSGRVPRWRPRRQSCSAQWKSRDRGH